MCVCARDLLLRMPLDKKKQKTRKEIMVKQLAATPSSPLCECPRPRRVKHLLNRLGRAASSFSLYSHHTSLLSVCYDRTGQDRTGYRFHFLRGDPSRISSLSLKDKLNPLHISARFTRNIFFLKTLQPQERMLLLIFSSH